MNRPSIKYNLLLLGLPLLLAVSANRPSPQGVSWPSELCQMDNNTFMAGEEIVYKVYYNWNFMWLSAGEVSFRVYDNDEQFHLSARGRTYSSYEWFFKVRDNYDSYIDKATLLPTLSIRDIHEGNYKRYDKVSFDQKQHRAVSLKGHSRTDASAATFELDGCIHDILSVLYYVRNLDFDAMHSGEQVPVKIFFDRKSYNLTMKYLGKEANTKVKGYGRFKTHKVSPQLIAGEVFKEGDEMTVYVSADQNKIPVLIESPVSVGSVKVVLKSYRGLKYPLTSQIR